MAIGVTEILSALYRGITALNGTEMLGAICITAGMALSLFLLIPSCYILAFYYKESIKKMDLLYLGYEEPMFFLAVMFRLHPYARAAVIRRPYFLATFYPKLKTPPDVYNKEFGFSKGFIIWLGINYVSVRLGAILLAVGYYFMPSS